MKTEQPVYQGQLSGEAANAARPAKDQRITLLWQGRGDGTNEGFEIGGMLVVPAEEGVTYVRREDAIAFFGLVEPTSNRDTAAYTASLAADNERLRALNAALVEALTDVMALQWTTNELRYLDAGIGTETPLAALLRARAALAAAKEQP